MSLRTGRFELSKWYFDCVADDGRTAIAYVAQVRYGGIAADYTSLLTCSPGEAALTRTVLFREEQPALEPDGDFAWHSDRLEVDGRWERLDPPASATLYSSAEGAVRWECHMPRARARVRVGNIALVGLGYVEHLSLTLPPWRLPIRELRWGRALTAREGRVWIDWRGDTHSTRVSVGEGEDLRLSDHHVLRQGKLASGALAIVPRSVLARFPARAVLVDETKWLARATVGGSSGWAIHEVVRWP